MIPKFGSVKCTTYKTCSRDRTSTTLHHAVSHYLQSMILNHITISDLNHCCTRTQREMLSKSLKNLLNLERASLKCVFNYKSSLAASEDIHGCDIKNLEDIPSPPSHFLFGHFPLFLKKENSDNLHQFFASLQPQYGDMVRLRLPGGMGNGNMVLLYNVKDIKNVHSFEERIPKLPGTNFEGIEVV